MPIDPCERVEKGGQAPADSSGSRAESNCAGASPRFSTACYEHFGITPIVNAVGYATRLGGSCPHPEILEAMMAANTAYVELDDLLTAAGELIARCTGAESGIITCGANAGLTLAAAACLTGNDPDLMDKLPDVTGFPRSEIIYPKPGPFDYDHAIRLSGAKVVFIDYSAPGALAEIERSIGPKTAAVGYVWLGTEEKPSLSDLIELAHRHDLPVIVDAALSLPPIENLSSFARRGADLIAYSGGKNLGGPQASGILCGRADLIRNAWLQMVDMDIRAGTWSLRDWIARGWISRPPRHGIGRSMKVGKESMIGLMTALERYSRRDHAAEYESWLRTLDQIHDGICDLCELKLTRSPRAPNGQPYPVLDVENGEAVNGSPVREMFLTLRTLPRKILLAEDERSPDRVSINAQCLRPGDAESIITSIRQAILSRRDKASR